MVEHNSTLSWVQILAFCILIYDFFKIFNTELLGLNHHTCKMIIFQGVPLWFQPITFPVNSEIKIETEKHVDYYLSYYYNIRNNNVPFMTPNIKIRMMKNQYKIG